MSKSTLLRRGGAAASSLLRSDFRHYLLFTIHYSLLLAALSAAADTHYVSLSGNHVSPFTNWVDAATNIQAAICVAGSNDQVWVSAGAYLPTNYPPGKGPGDGAQHRAFELVNGVSVYGGFTGGESSLGERDIWANPTVLSGDLGITGVVTDNCYHVVHNPDLGVGFRINGTAILDGFFITDGYSPDTGGSDTGGAGIYNRYASPTIRRCIITGNRADYGGGVCNRNSAATFEQCIVAGNYTWNAWSQGAGVHNSYDDPEFYSCLFVGNCAGHSWGDGAAMYNFESCPKVVNCTFTANKTPGEGGAMYSINSSYPDIRNCIIWGNTADEGMEEVANSPANVSYSCIAGCGGSASWRTGFDGIDEGNNIDKDPMLQGLISRGRWTAGAAYDATNGQTVLTCAWAQWDADAMRGAFLHTGTEPFMQRPIVANTATSVTIVGTIKGVVQANDTFSISGFRPGPPSPCTNLGNTALLPTNHVLDVLGNARVQWGSVDMGAHEQQKDYTTDVDQDGLPDTWESDVFGNLDQGADDDPDADERTNAEEYADGTDPTDPSRWFVCRDAQGTGDGSSWSNAFKELQAGIEACGLGGGGRVWVAGGVYTPTKYPAGKGPVDGTQHRAFELVNGVSVYGGFAGGESSLGEREIWANPTVLSGDMGIMGVVTDNCYHVVHNPDLGAGSRIDGTAVLDGCFITGGYSPDTGGSDTGGAGIYNRYASPTIRGCIITGNKADYGGGICNRYSAATFEQCIVAGNYTWNAWSYGAGVRNSYDDPEFHSCLFVGNYAGDSWGDGAGMYNFESCPKVVNCTFTANKTLGEGGAMYSINSSYPDIRNSIIWGNTADEGMEEVANSPANVSYSCIAGCGGSTNWNPALDGFDEGDNIDKDPMFRGLVSTGLWTAAGTYETGTVYTVMICTNGGWSVNELRGCFVAPSPGSFRQFPIVGNSSTSLTVVGDASDLVSSGGVFEVVNYSPAAESPCIDAGLNEAASGHTWDAAGNRRLFNGLVDMGAHEFTMRTESAVFLAGAYVPAADSMTTVLSMPPDSAYVADVVTVDTVPTGVTDWVLVQLVDTNDLGVVASVSGFLLSNGTIQGPDGETGVRLECSPGYYYLVAKHRNHLAVMSAQPLAYTNELITYDFTTNWTQYRGGTNACVELEPGVWGMIAGDADGDGKITHVDRKICEQQQGQSGYKAGDFNLDGVVDGND